MVSQNSQSGYGRLPTDEQLDNNLESGQPIPSAIDTRLPVEPPLYNFDSTDTENFRDEFSSSLECLEMEEPAIEESIYAKVQRLQGSFQDNVILPVKTKIMDPLAELLGLLSEKVDFCLNKVGNPLILRRFIYISVMSLFMYITLTSGYIPNNSIRGSRGIMTNHDIILKYAEDSIDLAKIERDLEYISSMPHSSGTKGDTAIINYLMDSFQNNGLRLVKQYIYGAYSTYPESASIKAYIKGNKDDTIEFDLSKENFNPMSTSGEVSNAVLIYGNKGTLNDLKQLNEANLLKKDFVLLLNYGNVVSEQILIAEKYGAKGIIFISESYEGSKKCIQRKSVALPQYWTGDALTPGWEGYLLNGISSKLSKTLPKIPTIPITYEDGKTLLDKLSNDGVKFDNGCYSGMVDDINMDMKLNVNVKERHVVSDVVGKIEGREQTDKAIIIATSRDSSSYGAQYPAYGTAMMLSLMQLLQEIKYKYDWKPLRNIYFISFGGSEFNYAGSTELLGQRLMALKEEIYAVVDISQVGIQNNEMKLNVQAHPILQSFFKSEGLKNKFEVNVSNVKQYGNWSPFMANGIPVAVISSPEVQNREPPIDSSLDSFEIIHKLLQKEEKKILASDLLTFILRTSVSFIDDSLLPFNILDAVRIFDRMIKGLEKKYSTKINFTKVIEGLLLWKTIGKEWTNWSRGWENIVVSHDQGLEPALLSVHRWTWNKKLSNIGRRQCSPTGIPNRPFYKNVLLGPALYTEDDSEDSWSFPGVRDAIRENNWVAVQNQVDLVGTVFEDSARLFIEETSDVGY